MKSFTAAWFALTFLVVASASANKTALYPPREIELSYQPHGSKQALLKLYYSTAITVDRIKTIYYIGVAHGTTDAHSSGQIFASLSESNQHHTLTIVFAGTSITYTFEITPDDLKAHRQLTNIKATEVAPEDEAKQKEIYYYTQKESLPYWVVYPQAQHSDRLMIITPLTRLFTVDPNQAAEASLQTTGWLDYRKCDGCERSDQFLLSSASNRVVVNVVNVNMGRFYEAGCEGTVHPWIRQLIDLKVPFTYEGKISALTADYWEGDFWSALSGKLYIGRQNKIELAPMLEQISAIVAVSNNSRTSPDVGHFYSDGLEKLIFKVKHREFYIDLNTGQIAPIQK